MNSEMPVQDVDRVAALLKAMGNARRLRILCHLGMGECSVGVLSARVGLGQSALSQHLAKLRAAGLVGFRRQSQTVFYSLSDAGTRRLIATLAEVYCRESAASAPQTAPAPASAPAPAQGAAGSDAAARSQPDE